MLLLLQTQPTKPMNPFEKARAEEYFKAYPKADVIYVTSDGQVFLQSNHSDAVTHQTHLTRQDPTAKLSTFFKKDLDKPTDEELMENNGTPAGHHASDEEEEEEEEQEQPAAEAQAKEQPAETPAAEQPASGGGRSGNRRNRN